MPMNNRILRPLARPLLLDAVPGAAAAYSLRQLSNAYTGPVITVRRSSDDAEADFKASEIDDGTLAAFCGAGDGFVKTWHDQSGNNRDASATGTAQPKIVSSGSLVTEGGKAALEFDGLDDFFSLASPIVIGQSATADFAAFCVFSLSDLATANGYLWHSSNLTAGSAGTDNGLLAQNESLFWGTGSSSDPGAWLSTALLSGSQQVSSVTLDAATTTTGTKQTYIDGALSVSASYAVKATDAVTSLIGSRADIAAQLHSGTISELIIYPSDQSANRERIEGDLAWYY